MSTAVVPSPLTVLSEEETLFRDSVHEFAQSEIAPLARAMRQWFNPWRKVAPFWTRPK